MIEIKLRICFFTFVKGKDTKSWSWLRISHLLTGCIVTTVLLYYVGQLQIMSSLKS